MSNHHNYQGGWNGGYQQQGGGGFAAHNNVQHRYQEDDYAGAYPQYSQAPNQRNQAPLYARGTNYQRGGGSNSYGSHRGHPQMGHHHHQQNHHQQHQQQRNQYAHDPNGYGNVNGWPSQSSSSRGAPQQAANRFGGFNPNAAVFTPGANFGGANDGMMHGGNPYHSGGYGSQPYYSGMEQQPSYESLDEETAAYEAMYSNQQEQPQQFMPSQELYTLITNDPETLKIQEVMVGLEQLISDPEDYESWCGPIRERIVAMKDEQRSIVVRVMLEMLMSCSDSSASVHPAAGSVLARLLEMMAREVHSSVAGAILPNLERLHTGRAGYSSTERAAMISLMGEMFERIETQGGGKIEKLGLAVVEHMKEMLKPDMITESIMKDLIYTAKVAGPGLDASSSTQSANDDLLTLMSAFGKGHPKLSESTKNEISVLIEQRESGWIGARVPSYGGQFSSFSMNGAHSSSSSSSAPPGCIIGPDGKALMLSEEERNFLEEQFGGEDDVEDMYAEMDKFMREEKERKRDAVAEQMDKLTISEEKEPEQA